MKCKPIEAAFLCLDPAKHKSGAGILIPDYGNGMLGEKEHEFTGNYYLAEYGKVETQEERGRFVESLLEASEEYGLAPVVIAEEWDPPVDKKVRLPDGEWVLVKDPKWTYKTILGIGEGWGLWNAEFEAASAALHDENFPRLIVERVTPNVWRDGVFGERRGKGRDENKATAMRIFEHIFGFAASEDISEAGCIGLWGTCSPAVEAAVARWHAELDTMTAQLQAKTRTKTKKKRRK